MSKTNYHSGQTCFLRLECSQIAVQNDLVENESISFAAMETKSKCTIDVYRAKRDL